MDRQTILNDLQDLLNGHADRRLTQETLDYYRDVPDDDRLFVATTYQAGKLISIAMGVVGDKSIERPIILTHREFRQAGHGKATAAKLQSQVMQRYGEHRISAKVAADNVAGCALLASIGFAVDSEEQAARSTGPFTRNVYGYGQEAVVLEPVTSCDEI